MTLLGWLIVLFPIYAVLQLYAIVRLGDRLEMDADTLNTRPSEWTDSDPPRITRRTDGVCPACGAVNDVEYAFCRGCVNPLGSRRIP